MGKNFGIRIVGDPILEKKCKTVKVLNDEVKDIIEDLKTTLAFTGGFGIAAPQIGIDKKIVLINVDPEKCYYQDAEEIKG